MRTAPFKRQEFDFTRDRGIAFDIDEYATRALFVTAVAGGLNEDEGTVIYAGGYAYVATPGATDIADLPGWLPWGDVFVEHFGAVADMEFELQDLGQYTGSSGIPDSTDGYYRIAGTNSLSAFEAADAYVTNVIKTGVFYAEEGDTALGSGYFIDGQLELLGKLVSRNGYRNCLWLRNANVYHSCIWINNSNGGVTGFSLIAQYAYQGSKPANHGQMGPTITVCNGESPFGGPTIYTEGTQSIITGIEIDVLCCRAGLDVGVLSQRSASAYHLFSAAGVEFCKFKVGVFGTTNIASNGLMICHWGMQYHDGDPYSAWEDMVIDATYHTCDCEIEINGHIDQIANSHGFLNILELSSAGHVTVGDISCRGATAIVVQPGDAINNWSIDRQKHKVMKGIRIGNVYAIDVLDDTVDATGGSPDVRASGFAVMVRGYGTVQLDTDFYTGTSIHTTRQLEVDVAFKSIVATHTAATNAWAAKGVYVAGCFGRVDLGAVYTEGYGRAVDIQYCEGQTLVDYVGGDGSIAYISSRGGSILGASMDKGSAVGDFATNGAFGPGYAGDNFCIYVAGRSLTTTTTANAAEGDTETEITALVGEDLYVGTPVEIGGYWVTVTDNIQSGVPFIKHTPLPAAVLSGATVTVNDRARLARLVVASASGETAVRATGGATIDYLDFSKLRYCGKVGLSLSNATINVFGAIPGTVGRFTPNTDNFTIDGDYLSHVICHGSSIVVNPKVAKHFQMAASGDGTGTVLLTKCRVEDNTTLVAGTIGSQVNVLQMRDCVSLIGEKVWHPVKSGLVTLSGTAPNRTGGYYVFHEDGIAECWLRNEPTDGAGLLSWTFPITFSGGSSTVTVTANAIGGTAYIINTNAPTSTAVDVQAYDAAGVAAGVAVSLNVYARGRWTA